MTKMPSTGAGSPFYVGALAVTLAIGLVGHEQARADVQTTVLNGFGSDQVIANDINNKTQIVGSAITIDSTGEEREVAFLWENGGITDLGTLGGPCSVATRIDEGGLHIVGRADISSAAGCFEQPQAFLWRNGEMLALGTLGGPTSVAVDVNKKGTVIGNSSTDCVPGPFGPECDINGFVWSEGTLVPLETLGGLSSFPNAINNRGLIAGASQTGEFRSITLPFPPFIVEAPIQHAAIWLGGQIYDIHPTGWDGDSTGVRITEDGSVVVLAFPSEGGPPQTFLYRRGRHEPLPGEGVNGYNQKGQILTTITELNNGPFPVRLPQVIGNSRTTELPNPLEVAFPGVGGFAGWGFTDLNNRHQAIGFAFVFFFPEFRLETRSVLYDFTPGGKEK